MSDGDRDARELAAAIATGGSLATAIRLGLARDPTWMVVEVVVQDEFTHDVIFAPVGPEVGTDQVLVLDCT
jgi:hypothetical protein